MHTEIRTLCSECGSDITLLAEEVTRLESSVEEATVFGLPLVTVPGLRFDCPLCGRTCVRDSSDRVDAILVSLGCPSAPGGQITEAEIEAFTKGASCE